MSSFHDALGLLPRRRVRARRPGRADKPPRWMTKQWDASTVVPAKNVYGVKAPGYNGTDRFRFGCSAQLGRPGALLLLCHRPRVQGGSGNPGDVGAQYGWHVQILSQTEMTATVKIWNSMMETDTAFAADKSSTKTDDTVTYGFDLKTEPGCPAGPLRLCPARHQPRRVCPLLG